jgi:NAD+ synthase
MTSTESPDDILKIDPEREVERICESLREALRSKLNKRGLVIAISGGVDSGVCAALCVRALGKKKVFGLLLPEHDSSPESTSGGKLVTDHLGIDYETHDIGPALEAIGCYKWRDDAIKVVFPDYTPEWKSKIVITGGNEGKINHFQIVVQSPDGSIKKERLALKEYLQVVAATNYKQRLRKAVEYFHADRLNYAVVGTPNRLEYDQGFFVKNGDGTADVKPIAHLYKTQVYALAEYLGLPEKVAKAIPTTDTYSMEQGQDEFYFALPYDKMDIALWAYNNNLKESELAELLHITNEQANFIYRDIVNKRKTTAFQHWPALLVEPVAGPISRP